MGVTIVERVRLLVREVLSVEVPSDHTDLIESGLIDSLAVITMIAEIERDFGIELPLEELDIDQFRTIHRIADFLGQTAVAASVP